MKLSSCQLFAQLCENMIFEASSTLDLVKGIPGGTQVVQYLHKNNQLSHDQQYSQLPKISWSELKNAYRGSWVILKYPKGVGAIKQTSGSYEAIASTGGEVNRLKNDRGGNILDFLKGELGGNPQKMWSATDSGKARNLQQKRKQNKDSLSKATTASPESLVIKFKPLWVKAITAAQADIKGHVMNMIKNDAFEKAGRKINRLKSLNDALLNLEGDANHRPDFLSKAITNAIGISAHHYYPDDTGDINNMGSYGFEYNDGVKKLLADIGGGDQTKLGTVLAYFKRGLITG